MAKKNKKKSKINRMLNYTIGILTLLVLGMWGMIIFNGQTNNSRQNMAYTFSTATIKPSTSETVSNAVQSNIYSTK